MSDGTTRRYDLIVGADGVHSHVRDLVFGNSLQTFTGWRAWYIWIDKRFRTPAGMTEYLAPGRCLGIFDDGDRALAIFFAACPPDTPDDPTARIALLKNLFQNELRSLPGALDTTRDDEVMSTDLASVRLKRWVKGRVVLLGDAAHAFEPHTGLGASMAMEDAHVLAKEISGVSRDYSVDQALGNYEKKRQERVVVALHLNRKIRTLAFLRPKPMRALANLLIPCVPERLFTKSYFELFDQNELGDGNAEETHFGSSESTAPVQSSS
jgi:2-polyprenyl-6-methoxyphenol hydroxylase-like FAD-dependent oxidoreductase